MKPFIIIAAIVAILVLLLLVHIYWDVRGGMRNRKHLCYSCGTRMETEILVSHYKGGRYMYCAQCVQFESVKSGIVVAVGLVVALTAAFGWLMIRG